MATAKKKSVKAEEKISGVTMAKIDESVLDVAMADVSLSIEGSDGVPLTPTEKVKALMAYYADNYDAKEIYVCDECGGHSVEADEHCPFCGDKGEIVTTASTEDEEAPTPKAKKAKPSKKAASKKAKAPVTTLVTTDELSKYTEQDLDDAVTEMRVALTSAATSAYDFGRATKALYDSELWKLRKTADGKSQYTNFKQFIAEELAISHTWAYSMMDVAAAFSREEVEQLGTSKLTLALKAPQAHRPAVLEAARGGASKADLEAQVAKLRGNAPPATPQANRGTAVQIAPGRRTLTFMQKPGKKSDEPVAATKITEQPWVVLELGRGVQQFMRLQQKPSGELQIVIEFRKES